MCNLYSMTKGQVAIRELARAIRDTTGNLPPLPGIFPDNPAPIVRRGEDGARELALSRSARRTHVRSVSALQPIFPATDVIAAHWELCSPWWSRTIRTARSRTSGAYLVNLLLMAPSSQGLEPPGKAGRFTSRRLASSKVLRTHNDILNGHPCGPRYRGPYWAETQFTKLSRSWAQTR